MSFADIRSDKKPILAAIDIGTNSIHMVVVEINPAIPSFSIITREKATTRLGDRDPKTGKLTSEAIKRSIAALKRCQELAISLKADHLVAVATSATREAANGQEFLQRIYHEIGLSVDLISGQEEARRIYLGVLSGMKFEDHPHIIIDIGGGSTELVLADSKEPRFLSSTKVGAVRLTQEFVTTDPIEVIELKTLQSYVRGMLERPVDELKSTLKPGESVRLVGTSGTIETLAEIHALKTLGSEPNPLNGYQVSFDELQDLLQHLTALNYEQRLAVPGMSDKRSEIIIAGATVLLEAMKMLEIEKISICERALREGMIVDWMLTHDFIVDRLRYQTNIRQRSVMKIAHKYRVDLDYGKRAANFALSLFDQTQGELHNWGSEERELLWAAAMLHNCGIYISHSAHHKHSYYLIRHAEFLGFTEIQIEIIANLARYHRKSKPKKKHEAYSDLPKPYRQIVSQLSPILRLAIALDRRKIGAIQRLECKYDGNKQMLHLHLFPTTKGDDCVLELWSLEYKKTVFEEEYGVKVVTTLAAY